MAAALLWALAPAASAQPAADPVLATSRIIITGGGITIQPANHVVPRNIATAVETIVGIPGEPASENGGSELVSAFPPDAIMTAELIGPSLGTPVILTTRPGEAFRIQPLAIAGLHFLRNIRLVSHGTTLLTAQPDTVTIEVIDRVLVSQVTTRPLTADEIRDRGIVVDQTNYQVVSFSAAFGFQDRKVNLDFPVIVPARHDVQLAPAVPALQLPALQPASTPVPSIDLPKLVEAFQTPNVSVSGLLLRVEDEEIERGFSVPPLTGVIVIPGNIAYLNQFFSILTLVSNAAPGHSNLTAHDIRAEIILPPGADTVPASGDDPLRMAKLGTPPADQPRIIPVTQAGPDGRFGTADDILFIAPQQAGNSEHLVEGLREGIHTIEIKISAMLHGLPIGPVPISGRVLGTVEVRNPTFALTLSHPATVTAGEEYDLLVTVTNTSRSPANFASVNLLPRSISGAVLLSDQTVQVETIAPGDSETVSFRLLSQTTGTVTATSFTSEGIPGRFELRAAVGALGIPMSPNTLVLPPAAGSLPEALRTAAIGFLGQAFALATSPVTPEGLLPLRQQIVYDRATMLSQAGQRLELREPLGAVLPDLILDWSGGAFARLPEKYPDAAQQSQLTRAQQDERGIDHLFRLSRRGHDVANAIGAALQESVAAGLGTFSDSWTRNSVSRAPHVAAFATTSSPAISLALQLNDPASRLLGVTVPGAPIQRDVPFAAFVPLANGALAAIATPQAGAHEVAVRASGDGAVDLGLVVPEASTLRRLIYEGITLTAASRARLRFTIGGANDYLLEIDDTGDGVADRTITPAVSQPVVDGGPRLVSAVQIVTGQNDPSRWGQLIGLVFSEEIDRASVQEGVEPAQITNYQIDGNQVLGAALQPGGRVVLLSLRDGIGPFVSRTVTVGGIEDPAGHPLEPSPSTAAIVSTIEAAGGRISGRVLTGAGRPVPSARLRVLHALFDGEATLSVKNADGDGKFSLDYLPVGGKRLEAVDTESGERGEVRTTLRSHGQHLELDIVLLGTGTVAGVARTPAGAPLAGAVVRVISLTRLGDVFSAVTDASGAFVIASVPVGNFTIEAAHVETNARTVVAGAVPAAGGAVVQNLTLIPVVQAAIQTGAIAGQVFRQDGTPAAGIPVYTNRGGLAITDATGAFRIDLLPAGEVTIRAIDQARFEQGSVTTTVTAGATQQATVLIFGGTATIQGVVLNADGQPVAGAEVGGGPSLQITNSAGQFVLAEVPLGARTIGALDAASQSTGQASVTLNVPGETAHVQIILQARGTIAGRVFDAQGQAVSQLRVFLLGGLNLATVTDANGAYRFENIPIGSYQISAFRSDFSDGNIVGARLAFRGEVRIVNVTFRGKGTVTGTLLNAAGDTRLAGTVGLSELKVRTGVLRDPSNTNCFSDIQVGDTTVDLPDCLIVGLGFRFEPVTRVRDTDSADIGRFSWDDVFVGTVTVEGGNALAGTTIARGEISAPGQTVDLELRLNATSVVTGTVFMPDGQPAAANVVVGLDGRNVVTDANGRFTHYEVPPGSFTLTASDPATGYVAQTRGGVSPGSTADVPIRLLGRGSVGVEVRGANGPIEGARVRLRGGSYPHDTREAFTSATGRVTFAAGDALFEGPFSANAFDSASGVTGFASGTVIRDAQTEVVIQLPDEAGTVEGRFLTVAGAPVANAQIKLSSAGGDAFATTLADGSYRFEGVRRGGVTVEGFDPVTARRGRSTGTLSAHGQTLTLDVHQIPQGTARGIVRLSTGGSVPAADITLSVNSVFGGQFRTTTALDGTYEVPGVSAGTFSVTASDSVTGLSGSTTGTLSTEGETVEVEIVLQVPARGRVEGHVTTAGGAPVGGALVSLGSRQTTADSSGFYFFDDVPTGSLTVNARPLAGPDGGRASGSIAFAGEVLTLNIRFIGTGSVSGTVTSGGSPVDFATVTLTSRNASGRSFSAETHTDPNGQFAFASVPVGDVSTTATQAVTLLAGSASGAIAADGDHLELAIALQPSAALHARVVREADGAPAVGMAVELIGASRRFGSTAADGTLQFSDLALGNYELRVTNPTGEGIVRVNVTLDTAEEARDLGTLTLDESLPAVASVAPPDGAAQVPVGQAIVVVFSERVAASTVNAATIRVASAAGPLAGAWALAADGRTATFTPSVPFADFARVNLKVTTAVQDLVGKPLAAEVTAGFQTADSVPPAIVSLSPAAGAIGVAPDAVIRVGYGEAINAAAFAGAAIEVQRDGVTVAGQVAAILNNTVVVFTPAAPLPANGVYQVLVRPAADVFGNVQPQGAAFSFSTIDTLAPAIALSADRTSAIEGAIVNVTANAGAATDVAGVEFMVNGAVVRTDTAAPFEAAIAAAPSLKPSFTISARATDHAGNISSPASVLIGVEADAPPAVLIVNPANGATVNSGASFTLRVRGTDDRGVSRLTYQTSGQLTTSGAFVVNPANVTAEAAFTIAVPASTPPGPLTLRAASTDVGGAASPTASIVVTVADASAPSVQIVTPGPGADVQAGQTATILVSAADNGSVASFTVTTTGAATFSETQTVAAASTAQASFNVPIPIDPAVTTLNVSVRARDAAGNESAAAARSYNVFVPDTTPPAIGALATASGSTRVLQGEAAELRATVSDNAGVTSLTYQTEGGFTASGIVPVAPPVAAGTVPFTIPVPAGTPNGATVTVRVRAFDAANNQSSEATLTLTVGDTASPALTVTAPAENAAFAPGQTVTMTVQATDDVAVRRIVFNATGVFTSTLTRELDPAAAVEASFVVSLPPGTAAGTLILTAEAIDTAGNSSGVATRNVVVTDIVAPAVTIASPADGAQHDPREPLSVVVQATDAVGVARIALTAAGVVSATEAREIAPAAGSAGETFSVAFATLPPAGGVLNLAATARDAAGNVGSATPIAVQVRDVVAPAVVAVTPANNAAGVDPQTTVMIEFSEAMDEASLAGAITLTRGGTLEPATLVVTSDGRTATLTPQTRPLALNTVFTVTVATTAADRAGNPLAAAHVSTFRTASPDVTPPRVQSTTPIDGATGVGLTSPIEVVFTEPIDPATVTADSFLVTVADVPVAGTRTFANGNARVRFVAAEPLPPDTAVQVALGASITDAFGNGLADASGQPLTAPFVFAFTTGQFSITNPAPGAQVVEHTTLTVEARGSAALGIASVTFTVNGEALPVATASPFAQPFAVPAASTTATLTIVATARNAAGTVIATDTRVVDVVVGLNVTPSILGVALNGTALLRYSVSSPLAEDLTIALAAGDATAVSFPVNPVILPAGQTSVVAAVRGDGTANTAVFGQSARGTATAIVAVSAPVGGDEVAAAASPVGFATADPPSAGVVVVTTATPPTQPAGLVAWWRGENDALDSHGVHHGTLRNGAAFAAGRFGRAFSLDGADDQIDVPDSAALNAGSGFTVAAWVQAASMGHGRTIVQKRSPGNAGGYTFETAHQPHGSNNSLQWIVWINGGAQTLQTPADVLQAGVWHHAVATFDGAVMRIFVDGIERASRQAPGVVDPLNEPVVIGRNVVVPSFAWHGRLDEIEIYGRALSAAEIQAIYTQSAIAGQTRTVAVPLLPTAASAATAVTITSSNPAVATATSTGIAAGSVMADVTITAVAEGVTTLILRAGDVTRSLTVYIGDPVGATLPALLAPITGASISPAPSAGQVVIPNAGQSLIDLVLLASAAPAQTAVQVVSANPAVATAAAGSIAAGSQSTSVTITAHGEGTAELIFTAGGEVRSLTVVVGGAPAQQRPAVIAPLVGVALAPLPSAGAVFAPVVTARVIAVRALSAPAAVDTPLTVTSSDPGVVSVAHAAVIPAGQQVVELSVVTGASGQATITIDAGGNRLALDVVVGAAPGAASPIVPAAPVGISVLPAPGVGAIQAPASIASAATLLLRLLDAPAASAVDVIATTSDAAIASFDGATSTALTVFPGEQTVTVSVSTTGNPGTATIAFNFNGVRRELVVVVGDVPASQMPAVAAPIVGVEVVQ